MSLQDTNAFQPVYALPLLLLLLLLKLCLEGSDGHIVVQKLTLLATGKVLI